MDTIPTPKVVRCYFDETFTPHLPAMTLRWSDTPATGGFSSFSDRLWELPEGVTVVGPLPRQFGVSIQREGSDAYAVRLLWDRTCFHWPALNKAQLLSCALGPLLASLGTDLWYLLDQPLEEAVRGRRPAA